MRTLSPRELLEPGNCDHPIVRLYSNDRYEPWRWYMECRKCRRRGPEHLDSDDARTAWLRMVEKERDAVARRRSG